MKCWMRTKTSSMTTTKFFCDQVIEAIMVLEEFAEAFFRDVTYEVKLEIRKSDEGLYYTTDREDALHELNRGYERNDAYGFKRLFISPF